MELNCPHIVQMALECEHAFFDFIVPYFYHMVITSGDEHRLSIMEAYSSYRPYMLGGMKNRTWNFDF